MKRTLDDGVSIEQLAERRRAELLVETEAEIMKLRSQLNEPPVPEQRWFRRASLDLRIDRADVAARLKRLESGQHLVEFDKTVELYVKAYARTSSKPPLKLCKRFRLPGEDSVRPLRDEEPVEVEVGKDIVAEYLSRMHNDPKKATITGIDLCPKCDKEMRVVAARSLLVCEACGQSATLIDSTSAAVTYDDTRELSVYGYKKSAHFADWLATVQASEAFEVPTEVLNAVMHELRRQRVIFRWWPMRSLGCCTQGSSSDTIKSELSWVPSV